MLPQIRPVSDRQPSQQRLNRLFGAPTAPVGTPLIDLPVPAPPVPAASALPGPGAFDPGRPGLKALTAVAIVVALGAAYFAWQARPQPDPAPAVEQLPAQTSQAPSASAAELVVAVSGKVRRPGLIRLSAGARVADAIQAAGGPLPGTDLSSINLARKLVDGELIAVGVPGPADNGAGPVSGGPGAGGGKVDLNSATLAQLDGLPGVGPVLAQRILDYRSVHGPFRSIAELRQVEGIGEAKFDQLKQFVTV